MGTLTTAADNRLNTVTDETTAHRYMRTFVDYLDNGIEFSELSQIRQLDIYLKDYYHRVRELIENLRVKNDDQHKQSQSQSSTQIMLINILQQAKMIGDRKIQLSQQILDATEQQSKKLKIAYQNHIESTNEQNSILNNNNNSNDTDSESGSHRPLWKRKFMINLEQNEKSNSNERDRKKLVQRNINSNNDNGKKMRINNDTSTIPPDETTYCLCSQLSYGSMILCDSKTCGIKWFHFNCVNLTNTPKGKWFCPNCRENRT